MNLRKFYLSNQVAKYLNTFSEPFLKQYCQDVFVFDRVYDDGTCIRLSNNPELVKFACQLEMMITAPLPDNLLKKERFLYIIPEDLGATVPQYIEFKEQFRLMKSSAYYIERYEGYYDQFWLNSTLTLDKWGTLFFNSMDLFQEFMRTFYQKTDQLLKTAENDRIVLPSAMKSNLKGLSRKEKRIETEVLQRPLGPVAFTIRERECVALLMLGLTAGGISQYLGISIRTVEHHIERIKDKLSCSKKSQIATIIMRLDKSDPFKAECQKIIDHYFKTDAVPSF